MRGEVEKKPREEIIERNDTITALSKFDITYTIESTFYIFFFPSGSFSFSFNCSHSIISFVSVLTMWLHTSTFLCICLLRSFYFAIQMAWYD